MTLLKLTLSISVLAASLMLVAPVKAETLDVFVYGRFEGREEVVQSGLCSRRGNDSVRPQWTTQRSFSLALLSKESALSTKHNMRLDLSGFGLADINHQIEWRRISWHLR